MQFRVAAAFALIWMVVWLIATVPLELMRQRPWLGALLIPGGVLAVFWLWVSALAGRSI